MTFAIGIDGGGSTVRVVVVSPDLTVHGEGYQPTTVNPNIVGRETAAHTIQIAVQEALTKANLQPDDIDAVGIGIAGALTGILREWMRTTIAQITPRAYIATSSDAETSLVGAHGERRGILIIAGTGSVGYGVNSSGDSVIVGGWGYIAGDEGSGYWLGREALRAATNTLDGRGPRTNLTDALISHNHLSNRDEIVHWLYQSDQARNRDIAALAPLVLEHAASGDRIAKGLVEHAARDLALHVKAISHQLGMEPLPVAFTGGLLTTPNPLSNLLCEFLGLDAIPTPRYSPVIGAALLALILQAEHEGNHAN